MYTGRRRAVATTAALVRPPYLYNVYWGHQFRASGAVEEAIHVGQGKDATHAIQMWTQEVRQLEAATTREVSILGQSDTAAANAPGKDPAQRARTCMDSCWWYNAPAAFRVTGLMIPRLNMHAWA